MAITKYDQFDFLIDIVPRDDIKPNKVREETRVGTNPDQVGIFMNTIEIEWSRDDHFAIWQMYT